MNVIIYGILFTTSSSVSPSQSMLKYTGEKMTSLKTKGVVVGFHEDEVDLDQHPIVEWHDNSEKRQFTSRFSSSQLHVGSKSPYLRMVPRLKSTMSKIVIDRHLPPDWVTNDHYLWHSIIARVYKSIFVKR